MVLLENNVEAIFQQGRGRGGIKGIPSHANASQKGAQWLWESINNNEQVPLFDIPSLEREGLKLRTKDDENALNYVKHYLTNEFHRLVIDET